MGKDTDSIFMPPPKVTNSNQLQSIHDKQGSPLSAKVLTPTYQLLVMNISNGCSMNFLVKKTVSVTNRLDGKARAGMAFKFLAYALCSYQLGAGPMAIQVTLHYLLLVGARRNN